MESLRIRPGASGGMDGGLAMSGHAPEFPTTTGRLRRWLNEGSDLGLSVVMLGLSVLTLVSAVACAALISI